MSNSKGDSISKQQTDDSEEDRTKRMNVIGLYNLGNTSYLNSVLQNLLYLRPFREQLIHTMTRTEYKLVPKKQPDLETLTFAYSDKKTEPGKLTKELLKLINETAYQKYLRTATPGPVRNEIVIKSGKSFDVTQQDSHGLFRFLIDMVKNDEIKRLKEAFFDHFDINGHKTHFKNYPEDKKKLLRKYVSEFENILVFTGTFIDDTFGGKMISTVECQKCRKILDINEDFLDISLHLSADSKEVFTNDSLEFYLKQFFSPKFLEKEYVCNSCNPQLLRKQDEASDTNSNSDRDKNKKGDDSDSINYDALKLTSAVKQFHIKTVGPVLTIHLKRFSQTGSYLHKVYKHVEFPLVLDMSPFCVSDSSIPKDCNNQILYGLRGIVEHSGGAVARDYVAYVNIADWNVPAKITSKDNKTVRRRPNSHLYDHMMPTEEWYSIKDSHISRTDHDHVFSSQAYMLFYEKLPLVTRDRVNEIGKKRRNNSEPRETRDIPAKSWERPNPYLDQSSIQSDECKGIGINSVGVIGLQNLGYISYLNTVLQNLLYLRPFRDQLFYTMTRTEFKFVPKKHNELETITFAYSDKKAEPGKLTRELFKMMKETAYEKSSRKMVTPNIVMPWAVQNEITNKSGRFSDGSQQDSHELFRFLIDMVKEEERQRLKTAFFDHFDINGNYTKFNNYSEDYKKLLEKCADEFDNISLFNGTFIDEAFGGNMISTVECLNCGKMISLSEFFLDISLPLEGAVKLVKKSLGNYLKQFLPKFLEDYFCNNCNLQPVSKQDKASHMNSPTSNEDKSKEVKRLNHMPNDYPKNSLEYYLMRFFSPIFLEEDYVCNNCNPQLVSKQDDTSDASSNEKEDDSDSIDYDALKLTSAVKQFHIKTVGPVLTIHLKRFSQTGSYLHKVYKPVEFPLVLDMSPFCVSDTSIPKDCNNQILYGLRGIVEHGGMFSENYVAYVNIADWNKPSKISHDSAKSITERESNEKIPSTDQPMYTDSFQKNGNDMVSLTSENSASEPPIQPIPTSESHLYKHVMPTEEWYYISGSHMSRTDHNDAFSSQAYILFYERLPLVPRDRVEEIGEERKNNSESVPCKTREDAAKSLESSIPSLNQSCIMEKKQSVDYKDNRIKNMRVIGLYNIGNTCYFNSVLQNLLYLRPFREQLIHTMKLTEYKLVPKKHPELETRIFHCSDKKAEPGQLTKELFNLIQETIYQSEATRGSHGKTKKEYAHKAIKPKAVQNEIAKKADKFSDGSQQDSHELFRFLIDMVKDEEIKRLKVAFQKNLNIKDNKTQSKNCSMDKNLKKYASEFENIFVFTGTFIDDTFGGKMMSTVKCEGCDGILNVDEDFLDISLHFPEYSQEYNILSSNQPRSERESNSEEEVKRLNHMPNNYPKESLEYYLMRFFSPILLKDDYVCNNCNSQLVSKQDENDDSDSIDYDALKFTSAVKQFHIKTVGPVLTIHLKRFSQTGSYLHKVYKHVEFPLVLDMSPFCVSDTSVPRDYNNQILYGLRGIVKHSGGMIAGHYVAYVNIADWNVPAEKRSDPHLKHVFPTEEWYYISDSSISETNHDHVFRSQAYILFYERLPLVPIDRVEEISVKRKNNSEFCETRDAAAKSRLNPSLDSEKAEPGKLTRGLSKLMEETIYEKFSRKMVNYNIVMPRAVQNEIPDKSGKFYGGSQQDSHELSRFPIDMVKEEEIQRLKTAFFDHFNMIGNKTKFNNCSEDSKKLLENYAREFENISVFNDTFIDDTFGGGIASKVECLNYKKMISLSEVSLDISLPLEGVVTIPLQRFYQSESGLQKVSRHVQFPLVLDMSPFCVSDTSILKDCDGKVLYGLRGIVDHTSWIRTGHCVTYVNIADWDVPSKITCKDDIKSSSTGESSEGIYSIYEPMDTVPAHQNEENKLPQALESNLCRHMEFTDEWYFISDSYCHGTDRYHSQAYMLFYERLPLVDGCTEL